MTDNTNPRAQRTSSTPAKPGAARQSAAPTSPAPPHVPPPMTIDPNADFQFEDKCAVTLRDDGAAEAVVLVAPEILRRIRTRAGTQDLAEYMWEAVFRRALETHVYVFLIGLALSLR